MTSGGNVAAPPVVFFFFGGGGVDLGGGVVQFFDKISRSIQELHQFCWVLCMGVYGLLIVSLVPGHFVG